jgi:hypothetical protein
VPPGTRPGVSKGIDPGDLGDDAVKTNRIGGQRLRGNDDPRPGTKVMWRVRTGFGRILSGATRGA